MISAQGRSAMLRDVMLPLSLPGIIAGIVFTFIPVMGENVVTRLLGGGKREYLADSVGSLVTSMNYGGASAFADDHPRDHRAPHPCLPAFPAAERRRHRSDARMTAASLAVEAPDARPDGGRRRRAQSPRSRSAPRLSSASPSSRSFTCRSSSCPPGLQRRSAVGFPRRLYAQMVHRAVRKPGMGRSPPGHDRNRSDCRGLLCMAAATLLGRALPRMGPSRPDSC